MPEERLQKILARAGVGSRRACEDLIRQGRVTVNGERAGLGARADPSRDTIRVDGEPISPGQAEPTPIYIALHKPAGVVSAASAQRQEKRPTVRDLVPVEGRLYPVGRLDADSEGLILLTNDGALTQRLTHPRYGHRKTYHVLVEGQPSPELVARWQQGVALEDGPTAPVQVRVLRQEGAQTWLEVVMGQGRKRQIRRTAAALGLRVLRLVRVGLGGLALGDLPPGGWRHLSQAEVRALKGGGPPAGGRGAAQKEQRKRSRSSSGAARARRPRQGRKGGKEKEPRR